MKPVDVATLTAAQTFVASWLSVWWLARGIPWPWWFSSWATHFLHALVRATPLQRDVSHVAWLHDGEIQVSYPRKLHRLEGQPILHIDGTANREIVERLLGPCDFRKWDAVRHATIYQVTNHANGKTGLLGDPGRIDRYIRFAGRLSGATFVCAQKDIRRHVTGETGEKLPVPSAVHPQGLDLFHFGQTTGLNGFECHDNAVIIGRMQPPAYAVEAHRGLFWNDPDPLLVTGAYVYEDRGYPGDSGLGVAVQVHPDSRLQVFLEQAREAGIVQALDRLRLCDPSDSPRAVFILTNLPLPVVPDLLVSEAELMPEWLDRTEMAGGVLINSPKALASTFGTAKAAENWLARGGSSVPWCGLWQNPSFHPKDTYGEMRGFAKTLAAVSFRLRPSRADRPPKLTRAIALLNALDTFIFLQRHNMKPIEVAFHSQGFDVLIREAPLLEIASAHRAEARLVATNEDPIGAEDQAKERAGEGFSVLALEGGSLGILPSIGRAECLRELALTHKPERAGLLREMQALASAATANPWNLPAERLAPWLRWGAFTDQETALIATDAETEAERLFITLDF